MIVLWDEIISSLQGTTNSLEQVLESHNKEDLEDNSEFLAFLDSLIFCCSMCGWWCEISEEASEDHNLSEFTCKECCDEIS